MAFKEDITKALDKIRPALMADGGNVELVAVDDAAKVVKVRLTGACGSCPMAKMTLKQGVERVIREAVPDVKSVEAV